MEFEYQPELSSELICIRPLKPDDFDSLYHVASDPEVWEQHPASNRYQKEVFRVFFDQAIQSRGALIAIDTKTNKVIGSSRFHGFKPESNEVEIGWTFIGREFWGGVYNKELKRLMLQHAFKYVEQAVLLVGSDNIRSQKAVEKIGGVRIEDRKNGAGELSFAYKIVKKKSFGQE